MKLCYIWATTLLLKTHSVIFLVGVIPVKNGLFSSSNGPIFLDSVSCNGSESRLSDCFDHATLGSHRCSDSRGHAGVICTGEIQLLLDLHFTLNSPCNHL